MTSWEDWQNSLAANEYGKELLDYSTYIGDAIAEIADSHVSIYTQDNIDYCHEHPTSAANVAFELDIRQANDEDFNHFCARVGAATEYWDIKEQLYYDLKDTLKWCFAEVCKNEGYRFDCSIVSSLKNSWVFDFDETISYYTEKAPAIYAEAIELNKQATQTGSDNYE